VVGNHSQSKPTIPKPYGLKATKPLFGTKKKQTTPASHIVDLTLEETKSYTASLIVEEIAPSTSVSSHSLHNPSLHIASTSATISDTISFGTMMGMEMDMDIDSPI